MSDVMTWNWHGNASGMPLGRNGNNQVVSYPTISPDVVDPYVPVTNEPDTAPDQPDPPTDPNPADDPNYTP